MTHPVAMDEARPFLESALLQFGSEWEVVGNLLPINNSDRSHWPSRVRSARVVLRHRSTAALTLLGTRPVEGRKTICHRGLPLLVIDAYRDGNIDPIRQFLEEIGVVVSVISTQSRGGLQHDAVAQRPRVRRLEHLPRQTLVTPLMPVIAARPVAEAEALPIDRGQTASGLKQLHGSFAALGIVEVLQAIHLGRKTGCLNISLGCEMGTIVVESGAPIHAKVGDLSGPAAFAALVARAERDVDTLFTFCPGPSPTAQRTIQDTPERLLLSAVVKIDEERASEPVGVTESELSAAV